MKLEIQDGEGEATIRICSLTRYFPDDMTSQCESCHKDIFYRPEPPFRCMFICQECGEPYMTDNDNECVVSPGTVKWLKENMGLLEETFKGEELRPHLRRLLDAAKDL